MYYFDTNKSNKYPVNAYSFIPTIKDNKSCFSRREIEGSDMIEYRIVMKNKGSK